MAFTNPHSVDLPSAVWILRSVSWTDLLFNVRKGVCCCLVFLELHVAIQVKHHSAPVALDLLDQLCFINVDAAAIWLRCFLDIHVLEHSTDAFAHAIISLTSTSKASLSIPSDDRNGLHSFKLGCVDKIGNQAFLKPPSQSNLTTS